MRHLPERRRRGWHGGGAAVAAALFHVLGARAAARAGAPPVDLGVLAYPLLLAGPAALLVRRRAPIAVLAVAAAATVAYALTAAPRWTFAVAGVVALFHAVRTGRRTPAAVAIAAGAYLSWLVLPLVLPGVPAAVRPEPREAVLTGVALVLTVLLGGAAKVRGEHYAEMAKAHAEQQRARAERQRRQASEERLRMARELHDVLGHHLSLISVQANVGLHLMDSRPEQAREALTAIRAASAEALAEVRGVLGVLRTDDEAAEAAPRQPAPGLDRLTDLTADAGIAVDTRVAGAARPVPPEVDRAAYRIVQEALTNVRRHGPADARAVVTVAYGPADLTVTVANDGPPADDADPTGNGIAGMRARAESLGGTLSAGPDTAGGFRVAAVLPTGGTP
ncbi:sensor histidine kinase [Spirilliplanes yamanashiensis]|uniref:histidine kinase n=1 Tax=Spirilliplanes yamanashiensis TaxID=42233 RepID=A0A8J3Y853_9ACTN|nr:sensor histidine kinase [Spirilliplanes yamanashiensis]MDP9817175.1 signal transduction histidine kinase [Spirilliplanes yamanashiensis]GIJ03172.1 hypothetical protein Sya03_25240 [Spirilliplanes yamanashiensis]